MKQHKTYVGNAPHLKTNTDDGVCVYQDCQSDPYAELSAPLCMDHAKMLTVQVILLTSKTIRPITKHLDNRATAPHAAEKPARSARQGHVYFIRFSDRVKIGFTANVAQRMKNLPHDELLAIMPGTLSTERKYHNMFKDIRVTGEWFAAHPKLLGYIKTLPTHEMLAA